MTPPVFLRQTTSQHVANLVKFNTGMQLNILLESHAGTWQSNLGSLGTGGPIRA